MFTHRFYAPSRGLNPSLMKPKNLNGFHLLGDKPPPTPSSPTLFPSSIHLAKPRSLSSPESFTLVQHATHLEKLFGLNNAAAVALLVASLQNRSNPDDVVDKYAPSKRAIVQTTKTLKPLYSTTPRSTRSFNTTRKKEHLVNGNRRFEAAHQPCKNIFI